MKNRFWYLLLSIALLACAVFLLKNQIMVQIMSPRPDTALKGEDSESLPLNNKDIETFAENLKVPWEIALLPDKDILVTERSGKLVKINSQTRTSIEIDGVKQIGEGGLLGLAIHPNYETNNYIYLYFTYQNSNGIQNRVERYKLINNKLSDNKIIIDGIKGSSNHDGGRIAFGPDGYLYITTGDAENPALAQDKTSLNGKVLRVKDDGSIPADNPFDNAVYSLGHRNPQGLAWDKEGNLWETEHGPSGTQTGYDEINIITKGGNYGWPTIKGDQKADGLISPVLQSGSKDTWAPAGLVVFNNSLFFGGLRGESLYQAKIKNKYELTLISHFKKEFGRIRAVALDKEGVLYLSTSNTDGRGKPKEADDKIIKINPEIFK